MSKGKINQIPDKSSFSRRDFIQAGKFASLWLVMETTGCGPAVRTVLETETQLPPATITPAPWPDELMPNANFATGFKDIYYGTWGDSDTTTAYGLEGNSTDQTEVNVLFKIQKMTRRVAMKIDTRYLEEQFPLFNRADATYTDPVSGAIGHIKIDERTGFVTRDDGFILNPYEFPAETGQLIPIPSRDKQGDKINLVSESGSVESTRPLFEKPGTVASKFGYSGDPAFVTKLDLDKNGNLQVISTGMNGGEVILQTLGFLSPEAAFPEYDSIKENNKEFLKLQSAFKGFEKKSTFDETIKKLASSSLKDWTSNAISAFKEIAVLNLPVELKGDGLDPDQIEEYMRKYPGLFYREIVLSDETLRVIVLPVQYVENEITTSRDIPLAISSDKEDGSYIEATLARMCQYAGVTPDVIYGPPNMWAGDEKANDFIVWMRDLQKICEGGQITLPVDIWDLFVNFVPEDWQKILDNWQEVKFELDAGRIPTDEVTKKIYFENLDFTIQKEMSVVSHQEIRILGLVRNYFNLPSLENGGFDREDLKKILEYTVKTRVNHLKRYKPNIWSAGDEMLIANFAKDRPDLHLLLHAYDRDPLSLFKAASGWIKSCAGEDAQICITEPQMLDFGNKWLGSQLYDYFIKFLGELNAAGGTKIINSFDFEHNEWIGRLPHIDEIRNNLQDLLNQGYSICGPETVVSKNLEHPASRGEFMRSIPKPQQDLIQAQIQESIADMYFTLGIKRIGFGSVNDKYAWMNALGDVTGSSVFDMEGNPNMSYYFLSSYLFKKISV